jgi:hypothetical protein
MRLWTRQQLVDRERATEAIAFKPTALDNELALEFRNLRNWPAKGTQAEPKE